MAASSSSVTVNPQQQQQQQQPSKHKITEAECKLLCLNREATLKAQKLLGYLSDCSIYNRNSNKSPGECLSNILVDHSKRIGQEKFKKSLRVLFYPDNEDILFDAPVGAAKSNQLSFKGNIDITKLDITVIIPILQKISIYATCGMAFKLQDSSRIIHNLLTGPACQNKFICCGMCCQCSGCYPKCQKFYLNISLIQEMRNKVHMTPQEFEEVQQAVDNDRQGDTAVKWNNKIRELALLIKKICSLLSSNCNMNCIDCMSIDKVVNSEANDYLSNFFDNHGDMCAYREVEIKKRLEFLSAQTDANHQDLKSDFEIMKSELKSRTKEKKDLHLKFKLGSQSKSFCRELFDAKSPLNRKVQKSFMKTIKEMVQIKMGCMAYLHKFSFTDKAKYLQKIFQKLFSIPENELRIVLRLESDVIPDSLKSIETDELDEFCTSLAACLQNILGDVATITFEPPPEISSINLVLAIKERKMILGDWETKLYSCKKDKLFQDLLKDHGLRDSIIIFYPFMKDLGIKDVKDLDYFLDVKISVEGKWDETSNLEADVENCIKETFKDVLHDNKELVEDESMLTYCTELQNLALQVELTMSVLEQVTLEVLHAVDPSMKRKSSLKSKFAGIQLSNIQSAIQYILGGEKWVAFYSRVTRTFPDSKLMSKSDKSKLISISEHLSRTFEAMQLSDHYEKLEQYKLQFIGLSKLMPKYQK